MTTPYTGYTVKCSDQMVRSKRFSKHEKKDPQDESIYAVGQTHSVVQTKHPCTNQAETPAQQETTQCQGRKQAHRYSGQGQDARGIQIVNVVGISGWTVKISLKFALILQP